MRSGDFHPDCGSLENRQVSLAKKWLITGASGLLGHHLCADLASQSNTGVVGIVHKHPIEIENLQIRQLDLLNGSDVSDLIDEIQPDVIVHTVGLTSVDQCEKDPKLAHYIHVDASASIAEWAYKLGIQMVHISTDHLWDGTQEMVLESALPNPVNVYGKTKAAGEKGVLAANPEALIARTNFYGPGLPWRASFSDWVLSGLKATNPLDMFTDSYFTPLATRHLCQLLVELVEQGAHGIYNVASSERISKFTFGKKLAERAGFDPALIRVSKMQMAELTAKRPKDMSLSTAKISALLGRQMPSIDDGIETLFSE